MQTKGKKLDGIVFTNADPSFQYTQKLDDLQGGDTTMWMEHARKAVTVNHEIENISNWVWVTSEQMKFSLQSEVANENKARSSKQWNDQRTDPSAYYCDEELEMVLDTKM